MLLLGINIGTTGTHVVALDIERARVSAEAVSPQVLISQRRGAQILARQQHIIDTLHPTALL